MNLEFCIHLRPIDDCTLCSIAELVDHLIDLRAAATAERVSAIRDQAVSGGTPSWEPIDLRPMSLLQDITRDGRYLERQLRLQLNDPRTDTPSGPADVLWRLGNLIDRSEPTSTVARDAVSFIRRWRNSARVILDRKLPPYPLVVEVVVDSPTFEGELVARALGVKVKCPVVSDAGACAGQLLVHRVADERSQHYRDVERVTCVRDDTHTWNDKREWLRLRLLIAEWLTTTTETHQNAETHWLPPKSSNLRGDAKSSPVVLVADPVGGPPHPSPAPVSALRRIAQTLVASGDYADVSTAVARLEQALTDGPPADRRAVQDALYRDQLRLHTQHAIGHGGRARAGLGGAS